MRTCRLITPRTKDLFPYPKVKDMGTVIFDSKALLLVCVDRRARADEVTIPERPVNTPNWRPILACRGTRQQSRIGEDLIRERGIDSCFAGIGM